MDQAVLSGRRRRCARSVIAAAPIAAADAGRERGPDRGTASSALDGSAACAGDGRLQSQRLARLALSWPQSPARSRTSGTGTRLRAPESRRAHPHRYSEAGPVQSHGHCITGVEPRRAVPVAFARASRSVQDLPNRLFHIDIAEVRTEEGKLYLFLAIKRTSKFAHAELHERANRHTATTFLKALLEAEPYKVHRILTDNAIQFCDLPRHRSGLTARWWIHIFAHHVPARRIEHRLTKPHRPGTNG